MKITCSAKEFIRCVNLLKSVVPLRSSLPAVTGILVIKDGPVMIANNMRSGMSVTLDAEVDLAARLDGREESCIVPGRKVIDICNKIKVNDDDDVVLEAYDDYEEATLRISQSRFTLKTLPGDQFPAFPAVPDTDKYLLSGDDLVHVLKSTVYAASSDQSRVSLCRVYLKGFDGKLTAMATDAKRFASASMPYDGLFEGIAIPAEFAKIMINTFRSGDVWLTVANNQLVCGQGDTVITSLLYEETFPEEESNRIVASVKAYSTSVTCSKSDFANAVDMALLLSNPLVSKIQLSGDKALNVSASHNIGGALNIVDAEIVGSMEPIYLNGVFVKNILATLGGEKVVLKYGSPLEPFLICSDDDVLGVVMPMRQEGG